jgi:hypothetical protein
MGNAMNDEAELEFPTVKPRKSRTPLVLAGCLLVVLAVVMLAIANASKAKAGPTTFIEPPEKAVGAFSLPHQGIPIAATRNTSVGVSSGFCDGYEVLCSTSTTEKPAETLAKLAAALPEGNAKRYRVKVSVVPLDEE